MSGTTHPLLVGSSTAMASNEGSILDASQPVTNVQVSEEGTPALNMTTAPGGSADGQAPEALALNLNLALESDPLAASNHTGGNAAMNNGTPGGPSSAVGPDADPSGGSTSAAGGNAATTTTSAAAAAANSSSTASTNMNSNSNTTVPTPAMEGSNPGSTKSTGLSGAYSSMNSIPSASPARTIPSDRGTNMVRMFQRMDELSARFIVMEEMFQKLCKTVEQQSLSITDLKLQNSQISQDILRRLDGIDSQQRQYGEQPNDQDSFVTDLLNSITNVSSSYLRKIRSRSRSGSTRISPQQQGITPQSGQWSQYSQAPNTQTFSQTHSNSIPSDKTFTLNPNGIKKRRRNPPHSNVTSAAPSYTDITSLNNLGTISLPNLALDHTGITPLLKTGATGTAGSNINSNGSFGFPPYPTLPQDQHQKQQNISLQLQQQSSRGKGIHLEIGSEVASANEDEDGYQEEDDEDENSVSAPTDSSTGASSSSEAASSEEEDEADDEIDNAVKENNNANITTLNPRAKRRRLRLADQNMRSLIGNSNDVSIRNTPDRDERLVLKNSKSAPAQRARPLTNSLAQVHSFTDNHSDHNGNKSRSPSSHDLNYTLLKAPSDVKTIWQEYVVGVGGDPPIKKLEEKYGNKWRLNRNRKTFARRKRLYKFIINGMNKGKSAEEMIDVLERRRLYRDENGEVKRRTIGWLQQSLTGI